MSGNIPVETFKSDFNINTDLTDVNFLQLNVSAYKPLEKSCQFGEKITLLYEVRFLVFNVDVVLKILAFKYENYAEVLKLEIKIGNEFLACEMASCKNFLQRKRNINLVFEVLIKFAKLFEMRRIICSTVFQKQGNVSVTTDDNKIGVQFYDNDLSIKYLDLNWTIVWNVEQYEVSDFIEFYLKYSVLKGDQGSNIKQHLTALVEPNVDFHSKLKLWRFVIRELYGNTILHRNAPKNVTDVLEIVDSDSDENDVIEINNRNIYYRPNGDEILVID